MVGSLQNIDEVITLATMRLELKGQVIMSQAYSLVGNQKINLLQIGTILFPKILSC